MYARLIIAILIIAIISFIVFYVIATKEMFETIAYAQQIPSYSTNPVTMKYIAREQDILGNSPTEYYLRNQMGYHTGVLPALLEGDDRFFNQDGYNTLKPEFRRFLR